MERENFRKHMLKLPQEIGMRILSLARTPEFGREPYFLEGDNTPRFSDCTGTCLWIWGLNENKRPYSFDVRRMRNLLESNLFRQEKRPGSILALQREESPEQDHYCIYISEEGGKYFVFEQRGK